jgi:hypothetical protein
MYKSYLKWGGLVPPILKLLLTNFKQYKSWKSLFKTLRLSFFLHLPITALLQKKRKAKEETQNILPLTYQMKNTSKVRLMPDKHTDNVISVANRRTRNILQRDFVIKQTNYAELETSGLERRYP